MAIDMLRSCLDVRDALQKLKEAVEAYGYLDATPEIERMQKMERRIFKRFNEWDKP